MLSGRGLKERAGQRNQRENRPNDRVKALKKKVAIPIIETEMRPCINRSPYDVAKIADKVDRHQRPRPPSFRHCGAPIKDDASILALI
jgi:hypothetical protein